MTLFEFLPLGQRCILVNIIFKDMPKLNADLDELTELARACDLSVEQTFSMKRPKPDVRYFLGKGKLELILDFLINNTDIDVVIFNHALSGSQQKNISTFLKDTRVIDRTYLILEIFSRRAQSFEGKMQVQLAQYQYMASQLMGGWTHLERQKGGIGVRSGPGERQIELDRRIIRQRISQIESKLEKVKAARSISRKKRQAAQYPLVALVGYTNAGKSSLLNYLTSSEVQAEDLLFATLDPAIRKSNLLKLGTVMFSDTVGFIRNLPHTLVHAFSATLEEVLNADLLLHVVDLSDPDYLAHMKVVTEILAQLGAEDKPILIIYNKLDCMDQNISPHLLYKTEAEIETQYVEAVYMSAKKQTGLALLDEALASRFHLLWYKGMLKLPFRHANIYAYLCELNVVLHCSYADENYEMEICISEKHWREIISRYQVNLEIFFTREV